MAVWEGQQRTRTRHREYVPALLASHLECCGAMLCFMLVFESDLLGFRRLTACSAKLDLPLIQPSLVRRRLFDILGRCHLMVQFKLLPEALVGLA